ncbi:MAG: hypothetical protein JHC98_10505 [Thermoleophilaceae bacterium]|nr:hypothetical protein [Thermoleophilaceae bacterium]
MSIAIAIALALPQAALADDLVRNVPLLIDEALPGFVLPAKQMTMPRGIAKFTTTVPKTAKGKHGIGIDGGYYHDANGAPISPGYSSSLTIELFPGDYTVYDSYKSNRKKGYAFKLHVTHARAKRVSYGSRCRPASVWDFGETIWVKNISCRSARKLIERAEEQLDQGSYPSGPVTVQDFTCYYEPFSAIGSKSACIASDARVTWAG